MTREEAIELAIRACEETWNEKTCKQIRKALEQEPSGDLISRQELLEDLYKRDYTKFTHRDFVALVQYQDTVQQEPKTGHWITKQNEVFKYYCDKCGTGDNLRTNYCPNCGCSMFEPQEGEEE